ncbi:hypothetical protein ACFOEQ_23990 [Chryseobacterium arachidis]|uniref:hypothetical protein n=1 Tax=Chryseobacterium arachidis TaxID=1416778 RepID=UPI00360EDE52
MLQKLSFYFVLGIFLINYSNAQTSILAINSTTKTVAKLSATDGSVINANFINLTSQIRERLKESFRFRTKYGSPIKPLMPFIFVILTAATLLLFRLQQD